MTSTFSTKFAVDLISYATANGVSPDALSGVSNEIGRHDGRINAPDMAAIWQAVHQISGDPLIGFHMAVDFAYSARRTPTLIMQSCETVRESLQMGIEYSVLIADVLEMELGERDDHLFLDFRPKEDWKDVAKEVQTDCMCATLVSCLNSLQLCLGKFISPSILEFQAPRPEKPGEFYEIFNASITFDAPRSRIGFPADVSNLPIATHDNGLLKTLRDYGDQLKKEIVGGSQSRIIAEAKRLMLDAISPDADLSIERLAAAMNVSPRTLQRRLQEAGYNYTRLLDESRSQLAQKYLASGDKSADEIGYLLGYAETTSFARAFRRWHGKSPREFALQLARPGR